MTPGLLDQLRVCVSAYQRVAWRERVAGTVREKDDAIPSAPTVEGAPADAAFPASP